MNADIRTFLGVLWTGFLLLWLVGALIQKRTVRREAASTRLLQLCLGGLAFYLLADQKLRLPLLDRPFVPAASAFAYIGLALTMIGLGFAVWARMYIGRNWSAAVTVKENHELVRNGPYALVRHPIYSGALLAMLGTAIVFRGIRGLLAVSIAALALHLKSRREERFMMEEFGSEYAEYKQRVKALVPFVW